VVTVALPVLRHLEGAVDQHDHTNGRRGWDPLGELDRLHRQLERYVSSWRQVPGLLGGAFTPVADVEETADGYTVEIELPGVQRNDLDVEIAGRRLTVTGERKDRERVGILRRRERTVGRFHYEVSLPGGVDDASAEARLDDGVLTIRVPKAEHDRPRRIELR
jgi:HSP20 family protein